MQIGGSGPGARDGGGRGHCVPSDPSTYRELGHELGRSSLRRNHHRSPTSCAWTLGEGRLVLREGAAVAP